MLIHRPRLECPLSKEKAICDWSKKDLRERWEELRELVSRPCYGCTKCGRAAARKSVLCKPKPLGDA